MQCPRCQRENPVGQKFCGECGTPLRRFAESAEPAPSYGEVQRALTESLARENAADKILRVISGSPSEFQPVVDTIVESAARLTGAVDVAIFLREGNQLRLIAHYGSIPIQPVLPLVRGTSNGRAVLDGQLVHVSDMQMAADEFPEGSHNARLMGHRTILCVPLMRAGLAIGSLHLRRVEAELFTDRQIALLGSFADQAVIAIENVRLFKETKEALEQQTATAEILRVISRSQTDVQPVFNTIVRSAVGLCDGLFGALYRFDGELLHLVAHYNYTPEALEAAHRVFPGRPSRGGGPGRAILDRAVAHIPDVQLDLEHRYPAVARAVGWRSGLFVPMLREGAPIGVIAVTRAEPRPFSNSEIELLQTFADQAVIAIENVRLFKELETRNRELTESLEQQTATGDILRVISSSPTDVQPVFDTIARSAARLCGAFDALVRRVDGDVLRLVAHHGPMPVGDVALHRGTLAGLTVIERRVIHVEDLQAERDRFPEGSALARERGHRTTLSLPLLREDVAIGIIQVRRNEVRPFSDQQIALLQTFADQAVIAIENVRLFTELQTSNRELTTALDTQTATSDILRVISRSQMDAQPVFDAIVQSAVRLLGLHASAVTRVIGDRLELAALTTTSEVGDASLRDTFPMPLDSDVIHARVVRERVLVNFADAQTDPRLHESVRETARVRGYHSMAIVPLLRHDEAIGGLGVTRREPGGFTNEEIALLETFADQTVIAIENVRMFTELKERNQEVEQKSRELASASQHKSEFLANMSHELRTPLNAIIGFSEVLSERMFGELNEKQEEYLKDIYASGTHLLSLINDILDLSKIEAGRMELELTDFHLPTAIDNALILVRERAGRRGIALEHSVDERLGEIRGDERKIKQVLLNLLSNALKFTPEGGRVEVRAGMVDGMAEISVADTGVGIAPEDQGAIFEEFRQVGTAEKKAEGTGLGLTLCRKFVELHGGRIWVKSQVGAGSTFTFTIPVRRGE
jgi:two-component system, NtrC family, sensor kinase